MQRVVGVRFQEAGKIYYFAPEGFEALTVGEFVVVETSRGLEVARVVVAPQEVVSAELSEPLKPITRLAYIEDIERAEQLKNRATASVAAVRRTVIERDLPMKVAYAVYNLDGSRLTVFFTSEGRVDFRDLVRDLSHQLGVQVQLRQVGPRDQAKAVGGYGRCGRRLCCTSWLTNFPAISIKMAKEQNLPLNPSKISGMCGRLLCCLTYEDDTYRKLKAQLPRPGTAVSTPSGDGRVVAVNTLRQVVTLQLDTMQVIEVPADALALELGVVRLVVSPTDDDAGDSPFDLAPPKRPERGIDPPRTREQRSGPPPERPARRDEPPRARDNQGETRRPPLPPAERTDAVAPPSPADAGVDGHAARGRPPRGGNPRPSRPEPPTPPAAPARARPAKPPPPNRPPAAQTSPAAPTTDDDAATPAGQKRRRNRRRPNRRGGGGPPA